MGRKIFIILWIYVAEIIVLFQGTPSTLELLAVNTRPLTATVNVGDILVFAYYSSGGWSGIALTGLTYLSQTNGTSYFMALLKATAANVEIVNNNTSTGGILCRLK